eukprot:TRINITY_DN1305_c0_g1_i1.p1 TRINITY_DN1305_c0_g1~~TRINITY_DN1305_c0_g1_i1.p1  ORF type:complete len:544 (-),score=11.70 TRINITY_DN1305_c0_g1_i1:71-1702(-)
MASQVAETIKIAISESWAWWWEAENPIDEFAKAALTLFVTLLALTFFASTKLRNHKHYKLPPLPPGPRNFPLIGNLPLLTPYYHRCFADLAKSYGPIFKLRLGTNMCVVLSSPSLVKQVVRDQDAVFANRNVSATVRAISYGGIGVTWVDHGPLWRMLRRVCVGEVLSRRKLDSLYHLRRREVRQLVSSTYKKIGHPINVAEEMFLTMLNLMTSMLWGGTLVGDERGRVGAEFRQVVLEIVELIGKPNVSDVFPVLARFDIQGFERKMKRLSVWLDRIFQSVIDQRLRMDAERGEAANGEKRESEDFVQTLLQLTQEKGGTETSFNVNNLKALLVDFVVAGTETSSITMEWAMTEVILHPKVMESAQNELKEVVGMSNIVEESHLPKLHYLDAVLKEVLRMHPPVPLLIPRRSSQSCTVGGFLVPKGTQVFVNAWAIHRDPEVWDNPLEFQPERFLKASNTCDFSGNDLRFVPFGSGRRVCAGIPMAERMLMYVLASLLHSFEWRVPMGNTPDLKEKAGIVLKKATPLVALAAPRLSDQILFM